VPFPTARVVSTDPLGTALRIPKSLLAAYSRCPYDTSLNEAVRERECFRTGATAKPASGSLAA
jgi:hypothetical protein